ncbi:potassium channel family protein [Methylobacterium sp. SI9]|uniref:potassium channel family protein n=1 Tax=Methylobacterium guangdongense TaxID=3138811 RepID=UPI00313A9B7F
MFAPTLTGFLLFKPQCLKSLGIFSLSAIVVVCISRISEVIVGFYGDALDKIDTTRQGYNNPRTNMGVSERLNWLGLSYVEVLQYYATLTFLTCNLVEPTSFGEKPLSGTDALFFSVVTITTTGYGDMSPKGDIGRLLAGCETLTGIILLVAVLASYISGKIEAKKIMP